MKNKTKKDSGFKNNYSVLYRSETNRMLAGVAAGLAEYLSIDPSLVRIAFIITGFFSGFGLMMYLILWLILPNESSLSKSSKETIQTNMDEIKTKVGNLKKEISPKVKKKSGTRAFIGLAILIFGVMILFENFGVHSFGFLWRFWPLILIILGVSIWLKN